MHTSHRNALHASRRVAPRGFTLVELLVVISIIALLMAILLPSLSRARNSARTVVCASDMRQFGVGQTMYANEYDGWYVPIEMSGASLTEGFLWAWNPGLRNMIDLNPVTSSDLDHGDGFTHGGYPDGWGCPGTVGMSGVDKRTEIGCVIHSYAMNNAAHPDRADDREQPDGSRAFHRTSIEEATEKIQKMDANEWQMGMSGADYRNRWDLTGEVRPTNGGTNNVAYRHNGGINTLRFDAHVEYMSKKEAWPDDSQERKNIWRVLQP